MYGIKLLIEGDYACFTRPEMKVERVSYDVPTPSAIRGIIESIYWKPAIKYVVDKIYVLKPIKFMNIRRNEVKEVASSRKMLSLMNGKDVDASIARGGDNINQRASMILKDVSYAVEAHFELTGKEGNDADKHYSILTRRLKNGQFFKAPSLGCAEFSATVTLIDKIPKSALVGEIDLGFMLYDLKFDEGKKAGEYSNCAEPIFYRPKMINGEIDVDKYFKGGNF
ncbi:MAG: type I-C CRISPR-associated protein Cas5c [Clostridia bacterium]